MACRASSDPENQQQWRDRVRRFESSSLTAKSFCAEEGFGALREVGVDIAVFTATMGWSSAYPTTAG